MSSEGAKDVSAFEPPTTTLIQINNFLYRNCWLN
jgi:hypothetical protein